MNRLPRPTPFAFALLLCAVPVAAQIAAPTHAPQKTAAEVRAQARPVLRPPADTQSKIKARASTAESGLRSKPALQALPPLPQPLGVTVHPRATTTARTGHWILVYRRTACLPCDQVTNALAASTDPAFGSGQSYTIVVGGREANPAATVRAQYDTLAAASWISDTDGNFYKALNARGTPMLYAMDGDRIAWQVPGTLGSPAALQQRATAWLNATPTAATGAAPVQGSPIVSAPIVSAPIATTPFKK